MVQIKKSVRPIPQSYRGKKRYLLFELSGAKAVGEEELSDAMWRNFMQLLGEAGCAKAKIWFVLYDSEKGRGIIRCANEAVHEVRASVLFLREVKGQAVIPRILALSGSIRKLKERI